MNRSAYVFIGFALVACIAFQLTWNTDQPWREYRVISAVIASAATYATVWVTSRSSFGQATLVLIDRIALLFTSNQRGFKLAVALLGFVLLALSAKFVLNAFPNSGDEYAYTMQADTYRMGLLYTAEPAHYEFFRPFRYLAKAGKWFSPYQAGWPAVMEVFKAVGIAYWMINPIMGVASIWTFFVLCHGVVSRKASIFGVLAMGTSAFFILNFSSYFSHGLGVLSILLFALFARRYLEGGDWRYAASAGLCIGFLGFGRAFDALAAALPFIIALLMTKDRRQGLIYFALGGIPFVILLGLFNAGVSGNAMLIPGSWYSSSEPIGHANSKTIQLTLERFFLLHLWTSPVLLPSFALSLWVLLRDKKLDFVDWIAPVMFAAFVFYGGDAGQQYGPRYYFEVWPLMFLTILKAADPLLFQVEDQRRSALAAAALVTHLAFQTGFAVPRLLLEHKVIWERQALYRTVEKAGLKNAVVVISSATGVIREMPPRDLIRNGPIIGDESVTYVLDMGGKNALLASMFPGRGLYRYACGQVAPLHVTPEQQHFDCPGSPPDPPNFRPSTER